LPKYKLTCEHLDSGYPQDTPERRMFSLDSIAQGDLWMKKERPYLKAGPSNTISLHHFCKMT
jgi:hypothetical protein